ncbi:MAG: GGDEF domain-containing protein [Solirubrobacterales bacterium]
MNKAAALFKSLWIPFAVLILAFLVHEEHYLERYSYEMIRFSVSLVFGITLAFSVGFKKARFFFILLLFGLTALAIEAFSPNTGLTLLLLTALPVNILIVTLIGERGIVSIWGRAQMGLLAVEATAAVWLHQTGLLAKLPELYQLSVPDSAPYFVSLPVLAAGFAALLLTLLSLFPYQRPWGTFIGLILMAGWGGVVWSNTSEWNLVILAVSFAVLAETILDLYRFAFLDELTGLYSRRCLNQDQLKLGGTYAIAMVDIDHFKKFNDTYGHAVGDQVLKYVAVLMRRTQECRAYRYGGEEFAFIFEGKNKDEAMPFLEDLQARLAEHPFTLRGKDRPKKKPGTPKKAPGAKQVSVTVSIGVADSETKNVRPEEVIKAADKALYRAKRTGRDRICS